MQHSAILLTFIKLPFVNKIFILSIFEWLFCTGCTVLLKEISCSLPEQMISSYSPNFEKNAIIYTPCFNIVKPPLTFRFGILF